MLKFKKPFPFIQSDVTPLSLPSLETIIEIANLLSSGKVVGWYQGNGEIGPRALGNRSVLMDPRISNGKEIINKIKKRENYRPFGASILKEHAGSYTDDFMLYTKTFPINLYPAITHVDGTCRLQVVDKNNDIFYNVLTEFHKITGCPILLNTSLNIAGKPIASRPEHALEFFYKSELDVMVIGNEIFKK